MNKLTMTIKESDFFHLFSHIISIALPVSMSRMIYILSGFIAMVMVGQLGKIQLAAGVFAVSTLTAIMVFCTTTIQALGFLIKNALSENKSPIEIGLLTKNTFLLSLIMSFFAGLFLWHIDRLFLLSGQDKAIISLTTDYFHFAALAMIPSLIITVISQFNVGIGRSNSPFLIELFSFPMRMILYYGLVLGHFGLPVMGIAGIGLSELIIKWIMFGGLMFRVAHCHYYKAYQLIKNPIIIPQPKYFRSLVALGVPIGLQASGEITAMTVSGYLMGYFGATALSALSVSNQYMLPVMILSLGLSQALTLVIFEMKQIQQYNVYFLKQYIIVALCIMLLYTTPFIILFLTFSSELLFLFMGTTELENNLETLTASFLVISSFFILVEGVRNILTGVLRGLSDTTAAMMIGLFVVWFVALPISYLSAFVFKGGPISLRLGFLSGLAFGVVILSLRVFKITTRAYGTIIPQPQVN